MTGLYFLRDRAETDEMLTVSIKSQSTFFLAAQPSHGTGRLVQGKKGMFRTIGRTIPGWNRPVGRRNPDS